MSVICTYRHRNLFSGERTGRGIQEFSLHCERKKEEEDRRSGGGLSLQSMMEKGMFLWRLGF